MILLPIAATSFGSSALATDSTTVNGTTTITMTTPTSS